MLQNSLESHLSGTLLGILCLDNALGILSNCYLIIIPYSNKVKLNDAVDIITLAKNFI